TSEAVAKRSAFTQVSTFVRIVVPRENPRSNRPTAGSAAAAPLSRRYLNLQPRRECAGGRCGRAAQRARLVKRFSAPGAATKPRRARERTHRTPVSVSGPSRQCDALLAARSDHADRGASTEGERMHN